ncbi:MAG: kynureninase [Bacteroidota bacterium]
MMTLSEAIQKDQNDSLKQFRSHFIKDDQNLIYLDGNSLGMLPADTPAVILKVVRQEWGDRLIRSWNEQWFDRFQKTSAKLSKIIGAQPDEVIISDSTSVNLFKLAWAALHYQKDKKTIVSDQLNFPSDIYVLQGLKKIMNQNHEIRLAQSKDGITVSAEEIEKQLGHKLALLTLSHVTFKSSFMYNMKEITSLAHQKRGLVIWDLSHAAGSVPVNLNESNADMAIGCTYKYLNGGPGSTAFLYIKKELQEKLISPIWGWFGQNNPFEFSMNYQPAPGIDRFMTGTPPLLSLSTLETSLDILLEAGIDNIRKKSIEMSEFMISMVKKYLYPLDFRLSSPEDFKIRGSHLSLKHPEAYRISKALAEPVQNRKTVIPDFREPDNLRLGLAPLYNTFRDIYEAVMEIRTIVEKKEYLAFDQNKSKVT